MKLLITADLHLGASLAAWGTQAEAARAEQSAAWEEAIDLAVDPTLGIDGLLVAGDLFDSPEPPAEVLETVRRGLGRLTAAGKHGILLPGIYDGLSSPRSVYRKATWPTAVLVVDWSRPRVVPVRWGSETLALFAFAPLPRSQSPVFEPVESETPSSGCFRLGLFHAVAEPESPLATWGPRLDPESLASLGLDLLILGGDHRRREALWGRTRVLTPGAPIPLRPEDLGDGAWTLISFSAAGIETEVRRRPVRLEQPPQSEPKAKKTEILSNERAGGGLRATLLRVYEERLRSGEDPALLEAALRYGLEKLERGEALRVD